MKPLDKITHQPRFALLVLIFVAFIALGIPDGLLGVAWPSIRAGFSIPLDAMGMLLITTTTGYMITSFLSGKLITRLGIGRILIGSCVLTCIALLGYTLVPEWWMVVLLGIVAGLGAGAIDSGLNTYVAENFNEGTMQWLHASYGIGVTLGPMIMTFAISTANSWRTGYHIVSGFQLALGVCFVLTLSLWAAIDTAKSDTPKKMTEYKTSLRETLIQPRVWLSMLLFMFYVGAEATLGSWAYTLLTESRGIPEQAAGLWAGGYWGMFTLGRILAGLYAKRTGINVLINSCLLTALCGSLLLLWNPASWTDLLAVAMIGLAIAPIFPALVSGTSQRVGMRFAANAIGMQMTACGLGIAFIPSLVGFLAQRISLEIVPVCMVIIFVLLLALYQTAVKISRNQVIEDTKSKVS